MLKMTKPFTNMPEKVPTVWSIFILNVPAADACFTFDCDFMDELRQHLLEEHGFLLQCSGDLLHGLCQECAAKEGSEKEL